MNKLLPLAIMTVAAAFAFNAAPQTEPDIAIRTAKVTPCMWPNPCTKKQDVLEVAKIRPCQWPNPCGSGGGSKA